MLTIPLPNSSAMKVSYQKYEYVADQKQVHPLYIFIPFSFGLQRCWNYIILIGEMHQQCFD